MGYYEIWPILISLGTVLLILSARVPLGLMLFIMFNLGYIFLLIGLDSLRLYLKSCEKCSGGKS